MSKTNFTICLFLDCTFTFGDSWVYYNTELKNL